MKTDNFATIKIPVNLLEVFLYIKLSSYEQKVLLLIIKEFYKSEEGFIQTKQSEMSRSLNIQKSHISRTIKKLIERNIILRNGKLYSIQEDTNFWKWNKK